MNLTEFKKAVEAIPETGRGCKLWPKRRNKKGYGIVFFQGKTRKAHRVSYLAFKGKFDDAFLVCHECDTPPCVNPKHLFLGTHEENMMDMARKGRARYVRPDEPYLPLLKPLGETDSLREFPKEAKLLYRGKMIYIQWHPMGGWMARFDNKNILNPWTMSVFKHFTNCLRCAKFCVRHGFYPGKKPSAWRARNGYPNITL